MTAEVTDYTLLRYIAALGVGLAVGGGLMILGIAKWGKSWFGGERGEQGDRGSQGNQGDRGAQGYQGERGYVGITGKGECPFAVDHPRLQEFMGESLQDRKDMRGFLNDINNQVNTVNENVLLMKAKLELIWKGAKVRWNGALPSADSD
jgi:hypothetical protein